MASGHYLYDLIVLQTDPLQEKTCGLTARVSRKWAGWDSDWEQRKLEARKKLKKRAESHLSAARIVSPLFAFHVPRHLKARR